ncbi:MAG TPA: hypothetical protein PLF13_03150 [candidate division Zixibacteria bacterium]|nr:hypothetical protein [candidate division Zixibacteria bacterium]
MAKYILIIASLLGLLLAFGCSDRTVESEPVVVEEGGVSPGPHVFTNELIMQLGNTSQLLDYQIYIPAVTMDYQHGGEEQKVPWVIWLAPEGEDSYFFMNHGLNELADELIAEGVIEPMAIVCIPNEFKTIGSYFYGGHGFAWDAGTQDYLGYSYPAGYHDVLIGDSLVKRFEDVLATWFITGDQTQRGIGGLGTGAYGAYRAALKHPGVFGSIAGADGPMDFDGPDGNGGLIRLMDSVFVENPNLTSDETLRTGIDSSRTYPIARLLMGGSMAFSPHDTLLNWSIRIVSGSQVLQIDTTTRGKPGYCITDSTSLIEHIVLASSSNLDFHLPFTYSQRPYTPIWGKLWMSQNLDTLLAASTLEGVDCWIGSGTEFGRTYREQTMSWASTLEDAGLNPTVFEYTGYEGLSGDNFRYTYELMRQMLIFHNNSFQRERHE